VALCQARTSTKPLWGLSSSNPYHPSHVPNNTCVFLLLQRGESEVGQIAVAYVIKNRCDKQVPNTLFS
jgi:hypothetical protein